ncbi:hypothetical protein BDR05DRAFT_640505 [Suillus weaverae]|nr:hypothetical protein BDR05DRAFT_640505 [Suillus weaverae]
MYCRLCGRQALMLVIANICLFYLFTSECQPFSLFDPSPPRPFTPRYLHQIPLPFPSCVREQVPQQTPLYPCPWRWCL